MTTTRDQLPLPGTPGRGQESGPGDPDRPDDGAPRTGPGATALHQSAVQPARLPGAPGRRDKSVQQASRREKILAYSILTVGALVFLIPFYFVVNASLKTPGEVEAGDFVTPANVFGNGATAKEADTTRAAPPAGGLANYPRALAPDKLNFFPALSNTVVITVCCVVGQILSCSLVGFGFARFKFRGRTLLFMIMLSTMMLPAQVVMIPVFILFRTLGMIDTFWPLIIPQWLASPFYVFMFRQFFSQIPEELIEAARIDGAGNWRIYWQLMLPLSAPVIAIVGIWTFLGSWNDFLNPLIYLNSPENRTLALALNSFRGQYGVSDVHLLMAATVVCMLPCVILFFAAQKYFVESVAMSGLKS